jgi:hypothetical protein
MRGSAPSFSDDQIDAMNRAFRLACTRMGLIGDTPVIELVAVRILELPMLASTTLTSWPRR